MSSKDKMRHYMSLVNESTEQYQAVVDNNEGRFGETALNVNGEEIENSVYLGGGLVAHKEGSGVVLYHYDPVNNHKKHIMLTHEAFEILKQKL